MNEASVDQLLGDLRQMIGDVESLLQATADQAGEKVAEARERAEHTVHAARSRLDELQDDAVSRARKAAGDAERYVREHPWQAVGIAAGLAFVAGVLVSRR
jgi:ElaB/YqjD/DUF883 family membrane-anchored ribosome-binding protein